MEIITFVLVAFLTPYLAIFVLFAAVGGWGLYFVSHPTVFAEQVVDEIGIHGILHNQPLLYQPTSWFLGWSIKYGLIALTLGFIVKSIAELISVSKDLKECGGMTYADAGKIITRFWFEYIFACFSFLAHIFLPATILLGIDWLIPVPIDRIMY